MDAFASVTTHWRAAVQSARGHAAMATWAQRCPSLAGYHSPADVVAVINQPGHPDRSCVLLADLLLVAEDDPLAKFGVLRALLPGLRHAVHQRWKIASASGPWQAETDLAADAVSAAWEAICHHAGGAHPLPARLIIRRVERRLRTIHDADRRNLIRAVPVSDIHSVSELSHERCEEEERFADELLHAVPLDSSIRPAPRSPTGSPFSANQRPLPATSTASTPARPDNPFVSCSTLSRERPEPLMPQTAPAQPSMLHPRRFPSCLQFANPETTTRRSHQRRR